GLFWFQIFIQASSPEIWLETISGSEKILAGKSGGLFLGYLLREKNIGSRGEAPPCIVLDPLVEYRLPSISWRWQRNTLRDIVEGLEIAMCELSHTHARTFALYPPPTDAPDEGGATCKRDVTNVAPMAGHGLPMSRGPWSA